MARLTDIANLIAGMKAYYPNYNPADPEQTAMMLMQILGDLPAEALQTAVLSLCAEPRAFAPSAGEIRWQVAKLKAQAAGIPDAWQAYEEVRKMRPGMWRLVKPESYPGAMDADYDKQEWSHPVVGEVAELMGWPRDFPTDSPQSDRAQFVKAYESALARLMGGNNELPQVTKFIEQNKPAKLLEVKHV